MQCDEAGLWFDAAVPRIDAMKVSISQCPSQTVCPDSQSAWYGSTCSVCEVLRSCKHLLPRVAVVAIMANAPCWGDETLMSWTV